MSKDSPIGIITISGMPKGMVGIIGSNGSAVAIRDNELLRCKGCGGERFRLGFENGRPTCTCQSCGVRSTGKAEASDG